MIPENYSMGERKLYVIIIVITNKNIIMLVNY